jgi:two-component sensor histidine kinase
MWNWLSGANYIPHGVCLAWSPFLVLAEAISDALIALAYFALPVAIWMFMRGRTDLIRAHRRLALLFVAFIAACGTTHVFDVITLWVPLYEAQATVKVVTALVSVPTAIIVWPLLPKLLAIPTRAELETANRALQAEIDAHRRTLKELEDARANLEARVGEQTEELRRNVADLKTKERHLELVLSELSHRTKNMLGVVQAIAHHTARSLGVGEDFTARFNARLRSLATAHDLLVSSDWTGAHMRDVVRRHLGHLFPEDGTGRIRCHGEDMLLDPNTAQYVGLALHELATNSAKYGALSAGDGSVEITWRKDPASGELLVDWRERGGPAPRPGGRRGFGRALLETIVPRALRGQAKLVFDPTGLEWELSAPIGA